MAENEKEGAVVTEEATEQKEEFKFVEDPTFDVDYKGECAYVVKVVVPAANKQKQADTLYDELKHDAEVPGFRRGRAPRKLIERKFAKAVRGEVEGKLVNAAFRKLLEDNKLKAIGLPDIEGLEAEQERKDDDPLAFTLKFEVAPRVELGKYRGISVERPIVSVDEKDLKEAIDEVRNRYSTFEEVTRGKAKEGDQVVIDFEGTIDGEPFQGGHAQNYPYILGTKRFFPEFEEVLLGAKAGNEFSCDVKFPEEGGAEKLRGKTANFKITVKAVKRKSAPALTDEFAKQTGFENIADLKEKTREELRASSVRMSESITRSRALDAVIQSSTYEIPKSLIEEVAKEHFEREVRHLMQHRVPAHTIEERSKELMEQARASAVSEIKQITTLNEIGEAEGIEVTEEDFEKEAESIATRYGFEAETVSRFMSSESDRRGMYEGRILRAKALDVIVQHADITEKEVPAETLEKEQPHEHEHDEA